MPSRSLVALTRKSAFFACVDSLDFPISQAVKWYYLSDSSEISGPVTDEELNELKATGGVNGSTQICHEGSEEWTNLDSVYGEPSRTQAGTESFEFSCPHCGQRIAASADQSGLDAQCPKCESNIHVPRREQEAVAVPQLRSRELALISLRCLRHTHRRKRTRWSASQ